MKRHIKSQARVIGIDDSPFDKFKDKNVLVIGTIYRGGDFMDGIVSTKVRVDGNDATRKIIDMICSSKFKTQLQAILLDGIAVAGFNIIDIQELSEKTDIPVIVIIRKMPDIKNIKNTLKKIQKSNKIKLLDKAGKIIRIGSVYCQTVNISEEKAKELLKITCTNSHIPEPIRISHIIASGIIKGESKGRA